MSKKLDYLHLISGVIVVASTIAYIANIPYATYSFCLGAIGMIVCKIIGTKKSDDIRIRRLQKIQAFGAMLLIGTAYLMFINHKAWVIPLVLSAAFDLIVSYRMPKEN